MPYIDFNKRKKQNVLPGISGPMYHTKNLSLGHFTLEKGSSIPRHHHTHEQWTYIIEGQLEFCINNEKKILQTGMTAFVPPNSPHSARAITKCKILDCFNPVFKGNINKES